MSEETDEVDDSVDEPAEVDGADEPEESAETDDDETANESRRSDRRIPPLPVAIAAAVVFGLVAIVMTIVAASDGDLRVGAGGGSDADEVARVAGQFSEALYTVDHTDLDGYRERLLRLATGAFETDYETAEAALADYFTKSEIEQRATVRDIFVGEVDDGTAEVVIAVDTERISETGPVVVPNNYVRLDLVKVEGQGWLVDNIISINVVGSPGDPTGGLDPGLVEGGDEEPPG